MICRPRIIYPSGGGTTLDFKRGPRNFICWPAVRAQDGLSDAGFRERVAEALDLQVAFTQPAVRMDDDLAAWSRFAAWASQGGTFDFWPNNDGIPGRMFRCCSIDMSFRPERRAPGVYSCDCNWRVVPDGKRPDSSGQVMQWYYGIGGSQMGTHAGIYSIALTVNSVYSAGSLYALMPYVSFITPANGISVSYLQNCGFIDLQAALISCHLDVEPHLPLYDGTTVESLLASLNIAVYMWQSSPPDLGQFRQPSNSTLEVTSCWLDVVTVDGLSERYYGYLTLVGQGDDRTIAYRDGQIIRAFQAPEWVPASLTFQFR